MRNNEEAFGGIAVAAVVALCSLCPFGAEKVVNASSFGWNAEDSTAALMRTCAAEAATKYSPGNR